jgi:glycosyl transferase family WbsX
VNGESLDKFYAEATKQRGAGKIDSVASLVYPGFDNTGVWGWGNGPFITPRENGEFYARSWKKAIPHDIKFLQIATWNDFGEGATIEPALEYGFQYLELTEKYAALYKGVASDRGRWLKIPLSIYQARRAIQELQEKDPEMAGELEKKRQTVVKHFARGRMEDVEAGLAEIQQELANIKENK